MVDHNDPRQNIERQARILRQVAVTKSGGDSEHAGSGEESIQLGVGAAADWYSSIAIGPNARAQNLTDPQSGEGVAIGTDAVADGFGTTAVGGRTYAQRESATAVGWGAFAGHLGSVALGHQSVTTAAHQLMMGRAEDTVRVPGNLTVIGTFSNPSARHLKTNIVPAPCLRDVFPPFYEYEYIARPGERRFGHMVDELVRTDAERFVIVDEHGDEGIDYLGLHGAQIAALLAEVSELRAEVAELRKAKG